LNINGKWASVKNARNYEKPNEDYCICDNLNSIYILLDGVSRDRINGKYPCPSPARQATEIFAHAAHKYLSGPATEANDYLSRVQYAFMAGNEKVYDFNSNEQYDFLPGTVGIIVVVNGRLMTYGFIGDCFGRTVTEKNAEIFTRCQTAYVHEHISQYTTQEIRNVICNNKAHPAGYGVLNGDSAAMGFVEAGQIEIPPGGRIILSTDGAEDSLARLTHTELSSLTIEEAENLLLSQDTVNADDRTVIIIDL
jgi:hypothetical protein